MSSSVTRANLARAIVSASRSMAPILNNCALGSQAHLFGGRAIVQRRGPTIRAMKPKTRPGGEQFVVNMPVILAAMGWELKDWAAKSGVSYRALMYYQSRERSPGLDTLDKLAAAAGMTTLEMLVPDLTVEMVKQHSAREMVENFTAAAPSTQVYVRDVLARDKSLPKTA